MVALPMATRRGWLQRVLAGAALPGAVVARPAGGAQLVAAWDDAAGRHHVGVLGIGAAEVRVLASLEVPTRAHGLLVEPDGRVLAAARRPGEWLLRWSPRDAGAAWLWADPDRRFNGHLLRDPAGRLLYSIEADLDSGRSLVVLREAATLKRLVEWPSFGVDAHQALLDADGSLLIANGGVPTQPETGRVKRVAGRLDSSLVRLDPRNGTLLGQWRLADTRLSLRHLARCADGKVGIALQAEHDDAAARAAAPLLALFDGRRLRTVEAPQPLCGYAGDIAATDAGFAVSAPRAGGVAHWSAAGEWRGLAALPEACALATFGGRLIAGGRGELAAGAEVAGLQRQRAGGLRFDNHAVARTLA